MDESIEYLEDTKSELQVSLDGFEGPLDLLLTLAKNQKVDLKKLQLVKRQLRPFQLEMFLSFIIFNQV